jgi:hypothetical protein
MMIGVAVAFCSVALKFRLAYNYILTLEHNCMISLLASRFGEMGWLAMRKTA